jgi:hypothetical protein
LDICRSNTFNLRIVLPNIEPIIGPMRRRRGTPRWALVHPPKPYRSSTRGARKTCPWIKKIWDQEIWDQENPVAPLAALALGGATRTDLVLLKRVASKRISCGALQVLVLMCVAIAKLLRIFGRPAAGRFRFACNR